MLAGILGFHHDRSGSMMASKARRSILPKKYLWPYKSPLVILKLESAVNRIKVAACALIRSACPAICSDKEVALKSSGVNGR